MIKILLFGGGETSNSRVKRVETFYVFKNWCKITLVGRKGQKVGQIVIFLAKRLYLKSLNASNIINIE